MSNPLETIEAGIKSGDMSLVAEGYRGISGKFVPVGVKAGFPAGKILDAVRYYADESNWKPGGDAFNPTPAPVAADRGQMAREALWPNAEFEIAADIEQTVGLGMAPPIEQGKAVILEPAPTPSPAKTTGGAIDFSEFINKPNPPQTQDGKRYTRKAPHVIPENKFVDNPNLEKDSSTNFDKLVLSKISPTPRQRGNRTVNEQVEVTCNKCSRSFMVEKWEAERKLEGEPCLQICTGCMKGGRRRRD